MVGDHSDNRQIRSRNVRRTILAMSVAVVLLSLLSWLVLSFKWHLHIPYPGADGKTAYYSVLYNLKSFDLFSLAQQHDIVGATQLGTRFQSRPHTSRFRPAAWQVEIFAY